VANRTPTTVDAVSFQDLHNSAAARIDDSDLAGDDGVAEMLDARDRSEPVQFHALRERRPDREPEGGWNGR
jgi:hypothetical protein